MSTAAPYDEGTHTTFFHLLGDVGSMRWMGRVDPLLNRTSICSRPTRHIVAGVSAKDACKCISNLFVKIDVWQPVWSRSLAIANCQHRGQCRSTAILSAPRRLAGMVASGCEVLAPGDTSRLVNTAGKTLLPFSTTRSQRGACSVSLSVVLNVRAPSLWRTARTVTSKHSIFRLSSSSHRWM
jgi:hypothetical protein